MPLIDNHKVIFDGINKLILVKTGTISLDVATDLYSDWKEWMTDNSQGSVNSKFPQAMRTVGGDPTVGGDSLGATFFLMNNWKIRPFESNHTLEVNGNLFVDGGGDPIVPPVQNSIVLVRMKVSNLVDKVSTTDVSSSFNTDDRAMITIMSSTLTQVDSNVLINSSTLNTMSASLQRAYEKITFNSGTLSVISSSISSSFYKIGYYTSYLSDLFQGEWEIKSNGEMYFYSGTIAQGHETVKFQLYDKNGNIFVPPEGFATKRIKI